MLYGWMKSLILYLIMSGLVLNMSPSGNYRKYISFFSGLLVIIIIVKPLSFFIKFNISDVEKLAYGMENYMKQESIFKDGDNMSDYYDMGIKAAMLTSLSDMGYDDCEVNIVMDKNKNLISVTIRIKGSPGKDDIDRIKNYIFEVYYVDVDSINIVRR